MRSEPWFRFFPSKFMAGIRGLNANEVKVYISLLCRMYEHGGPIRNDHEILSTYCEMRPSSFAKALDRLVRLEKLYVTEDGMLSNGAAEGEISRRESYSENAKRAGEKSAEKRQQKQRPKATSAERTLNHIDKDKDKEKDKKESPAGSSKSKSDLVSVSDFPDDVSREVAQGFLDHRKRKRSPLSKIALRRMNTELNKLRARGISPDSAIQHAIFRGWTGIQSDWISDSDIAQASRDPPKKTVPEEELRRRREWRKRMFGSERKEG